MSPLTIRDECYIYRCSANCPLPNTDHPKADPVQYFADVDAISPAKKYTILCISPIVSLGKMTSSGIFGIDSSTTNRQIEALKKTHMCLQKSMEQLKISDDSKSKK